MLLNEKSYILMCSHAIIRLNKNVYYFFLRRRDMIYVSLIVAVVAAILLTPLVKRLAFRIGAVDAPNY